MKNLIKRLSIVITVLIVATMVKTLKVETQQIVGVQQPHKAVPAMVFWRKDSLKVMSVGWVDIRGDSLIFISHIDDNGDAHNVLVLPRSAVDSIALLRPVQTAVLKKPPNGG